MEQTARINDCEQIFEQDNREEELKAALSELHRFLADNPKLQVVQQEIESRLENEPDIVSRLAVIGYVIRTRLNDNLQKIRRNALNN
ncbi:MAG: hypothetical protein HQK57_15525 [Deltaproteobacteria bacterium]|nr:hypothetical protein [Deltaproteobacteria bacterium]MBF0525395.1 hypothetical protein [Deltaproteobacteria bacterium]